MPTSPFTISAPHAHGGHLHTHPHRGPHRHLRHPRRSGQATGPLTDPVYRRLFAAQVVALVGTGVTTVALGLLAYDLAGPNAGSVLGAALALKMIAYVGLAPVVAAVAHRFDRRRMLITLDVVRAMVLFVLPFVTEVWQVFVLIFVVNACAAGFTPAFQTTIPEVLPDEADYTRALSLSRVAYDLGELLSPALAGALLLLVDFDALFAVNGVTFVLSAALIAGLALPARSSVVSDRSRERITLGIRRFTTVPRLRALLALNLAVASASAMTIVNTVVLVRDDLELGASAVALALCATAAGSVFAAALVPRLLTWVSDRTLMLLGGALLAGALPVVAALGSYAGLLVLWVVLGAGLGLVQTPAGRLLRRSGNREDLAPLFAAQFALSHACWLITYPVAGALGVAFGVGAVAIALGVVCALAVTIAAVQWQAEGIPPG
ncbi:MFS transporter [Paraconexibacter algicola]|uniref:MFS transporter n=1 Tax=Paraconexibacter algicola TaxID=2133960 RepID=A0A2T4UM52_9ACTN|nr:MFS transporter [Paraconexibacter algicola]PTL60323.1 MFS transporter [Paraconexibacter algicola]